MTDSIRVPRRQWIQIVQRIKKLEDRVARLVEKDPESNHRKISPTQEKESVGYG